MAEVIKHDAGDNNFARGIIHFTKKSLNKVYFSNHRVYFKGTVKRFFFWKSDRSPYTSFDSVERNRAPIAH